MSIFVKYTSRVFLLFIILFNCFKVYSEDSAEDYSEEDIIYVNGTKLEQEISESVEKKSVISNEEIKNSGAKNIGEALKTLPEITVSGATAGNANETVSMQGLGNGYVKIMIDGISVSSGIDGTTPVFQIPVENIERIEITKGADSVLNGSDSMGGSINIITKNHDKNEEEKLTFSGSITEEAGWSPSLFNWKNYLAGSFLVSGTNLSNTLSACLSYIPGKEKTAFDALAGKISYYENTQKILGFARNVLTWKDDWGNISLYGLYTDSDQKSNFTKTGYDKGAQMDYRSLRSEAGIKTKYILSDDFFVEGFSSGKFYYMDTTYDVKAGSYSSSKGTESSSLDWETDIRAGWKLNESNDFIFGFNTDLESIKGSSFDERKYALETSLFVQDTVSFFYEKLYLIPGVRLDYSPEVQNSSACFMATPKLALKYTPTEFTAFRISYGMGYRMPSLKEKYWIFRHSYAPGAGNFILYGNSDLKSEKSHSFNAELEKNVENYFKISSGTVIKFDICSASNPRSCVFCNSPSKASTRALSIFSDAC